VISTGEITLQNIKIDRSNIGVVNTGSIGNLDVSVSAIRNLGHDEIADELRTLTEAVLASSDLADTEKRDVVDQLSYVASQAAVPGFVATKSAGGLGSS